MSQLLSRIRILALLTRSLEPAQYPVDDDVVSEQTEDNDITPHFLIPQIPVVHMVAIIPTALADLHPRKHCTPVVGFFQEAWVPRSPFCALNIG